MEGDTSRSMPGSGEPSGNARSGISPLAGGDSSLPPPPNQLRCLGMRSIQVVSVVARLWFCRLSFFFAKKTVRATTRLAWSRLRCWPQRPSECTVGTSLRAGDADT